MPRNTHRFILEWIPAAVLQSVNDEHKAEIDSGASVWDFVSPESIAMWRECQTEKQAFNAAKSLLPLDEYGEIHVFKQMRVAIRPYWVTTHRAVVDKESAEFEWESFDTAE